MGRRRRRGGQERRLTCQETGRFWRGTGARVSRRIPKKCRARVPQHRVSARPRWGARGAHPGAAFSLTPRAGTCAASIIIPCFLRRLGNNLGSPVRQVPGADADTYVWLRFSRGGAGNIRGIRVRALGRGRPCRQGE